MGKKQTKKHAIVKWGMKIKLTITNRACISRIGGLCKVVELVWGWGWGLGVGGCFPATPEEVIVSRCALLASGDTALIEVFVILPPVISV